jgi:hypothetical protein
MASHWLVTLSLTSRFVWKRLLDNKMKFNALTKRALPIALDTILSHVDESGLEKIFRLGARMTEDSKAELIQLANMCRDRDPMVKGWMGIYAPSTKSQKKLITNLIFNHVVSGAELRDMAGEKYSTHIPFLVLISPPMNATSNAKVLFRAVRKSLPLHRRGNIRSYSTVLRFGRTLFYVYRW